MIDKISLTCIRCPMGCALSVEVEEKKVLSVTGNRCKRGSEYARKEVISPTRTVTSTVRTQDGRVVSVKTKEDIPKGKIYECMAAINEVVVHTPVVIGEVIINDVAGTGVDVIATKNLI